jgi:hypothetical protein
MDAFGSDVMIGEREPIAGNKGSRATIIESDRGEANVIQPWLGGSKAIFGFDLRHRKSVEEPHAFIGQRDGAQGETSEATQRNQAPYHK